MGLTRFELFARFKKLNKPGFSWLGCPSASVPVASLNFETMKLLYKRLVIGSTVSHF